MAHIDQSWAIERRFDYIDWALATSGSLRRSDLVNIFGVSLGQASHDIY